MDEDGTILCVHHPTASSLQNSAIEGCHICALVWERLASCQQKLLLELSTDRNPITNMFMATPQTLELDLHLFGTESLILGVSFDVGDEIWNLPGGAAEKTNMFVLQPSERMYFKNEFSTSNGSILVSLFVVALYGGRLTFLQCSTT